MNENYLTYFRYGAEINIQALWAAIKERFKYLPYFGDLIVFEEKEAEIIEMNVIHRNIEKLNENINENEFEINGIYRSIEKLIENVNELQKNQKIDDTYIQNNQREIYFLFKMFIGSVYNQPNEEYIDYLSCYLSNCLNKDFSEVKLKVSIFNKLARYTNQHIEILKILYDDCMLHGGWHCTDLKNKKDLQLKKLEHINRGTSDYCINELLSDGFLRQVTGMFQPANGEFSYYDSLSTENSPYSIAYAGVICLGMLNKIKDI